MDTTRDRPPPWVQRGIATTVGTTRDSVETRRHKAHEALRFRVTTPTRSVSLNPSGTALLAHTRPERSVVHVRSFRDMSQKERKNWAFTPIVHGVWGVSLVRHAGNGATAEQHRVGPGSKCSLQCAGGAPRASWGRAWGRGRPVPAEVARAHVCAPEPSACFTQRTSNHRKKHGGLHRDVGH